ncbi:MAG: hypothetical protein EB054_00080 [Actinobacteria bacterium]|nr:hypothetical protein [Actinomycetota bacterium]
MLMHLLIASFFILVGAEIRKELAHPKELLPPFFAAVGGMALPALIFRILQPHSDAWGATMPTDIVLVLAVIALLGKRVDSKVRLFVLALAVSDDLLSLAVIAIFYRGDLDFATSASTFIATAIGFLAPAREKIIKLLTPWAFYVVTPIVILSHLPQSFSFDSTVQSYLIARILGKVIGIATVAWLLIRREMIGIGLLCGMGMTVSLIINEIATTGEERTSIDAAIYLATAICGISGYCWLRWRAKLTA